MAAEKQSGEQGQAFAEMVVCLIPVLFIFIGIFIVGVFGLENLKMTILARTAADNSAVMGYLYNPDDDSSGAADLQKVSAQHIRTWSYGNDRLPFTADDTPVIESGAITVNYSMRQTFDTEKYTADQNSSRKIASLALGSVSEKKMISQETASFLQADSDSADLAGVFLSSADLFGVKSAAERSLERYGFSTGSRLYTELAGGELTITGRAFMPAREYLSNNAEKETEN